MSRSYSPPTPAPGWAVYQAQGLAVGDWRAQVTFDDPNPPPSGTDCVSDHTTSDASHPRRAPESPAQSSRWHQSRRTRGVPLKRGHFDLTGHDFRDPVRGWRSGRITAIGRGLDAA